MSLAVVFLRGGNSGERSSGNTVQGCLYLILARGAKAPLWNFGKIASRLCESSAEGARPKSFKVRRTASHLAQRTPSANRPGLSNERVPTLFADRLFAVKVGFQNKRTTSTNLKSILALLGSWTTV